ncbi:MAG: glycosyltransferase family 39 protein [Polyangiaceae bacterium]
MAVKVDAPEPRVRRSVWLAVLSLLVAYAVQCLAFARANAQTYDEGVNLAAGLRILETGRDDVNLEHPPLAKVLVALPVAAFAKPHVDLDAWAARRESAFGLGRDVFYSSGVSHETLLWLGRAPVMLLALALVFSIGAFAWRLFGPRAAVVAVGLAAFDPNLVAHGSLMGLDLPLTLFVTGMFFVLHEYARTRRASFLLAAGLLGGFALATKHSGPVYLGAALAGLVAHAAISGDQGVWWESDRAAPSRLRAVGHALGNALLVAGLALFVVRVALGSAGWGAYFAGVRAQLAHQSHGHPAFFMGRIASDGFPLYFPVALALKMPPLTLLAGLLSVVALRRGTPFGRAVFFVLVPLVLVLATLFFARINIGVRYALPLWPLFILLASRLATLPAHRARVWGFAFVAALHVLAAIRISPHHLAFASDLAGGPSRLRRYLADSNLDWGQDIGTLGRWLREREPPRRLYLSYFGTAEPRAYGVEYLLAPTSCPHPAPWQRPAERASGRELLAVSVMNLQGVFFGSAAPYAWLEARTPVAVLGHSIHVYDITDDLAAHSALAELYERYGPKELAIEERARVAALGARTP